MPPKIFLEWFVVTLAKSTKVKMGLTPLSYLRSHKNCFNFATSKSQRFEVKSSSSLIKDHVLGQMLAL